ncbi:MAG TPA: response regulator transcription factor [Candidatus Bathyarchaeia archaeon]|nr:response regulator transcription factor [Candidatus Bathyarchaeia archaeon]
MRVLLVEDDRKAARLAKKGLQEAGFLVDVAFSAEDGDEMVGAVEYDAIVLDWLLPGKDGATLCRDLRARDISTPILMLTARRSLDDRVTGLNVGADDYLTKPFAFAELVARLQALLRRSAITRPVTLTVGDLTLDPVSHEVSRAGAPVSLTPKEFAILELLMRHPGELLTRTRLGEHVWHDDSDINNLVDVHMSHLRKKIDRPPLDPLIQTVWGRGYRLGTPR